MPSASRIYHVHAFGDDYLVRAPSRAQAVAHMARTHINAELASQDKLVELLDVKTPILVAGEDDQLNLEV